VVGLFKIAMLSRKGENATGINVCQMILHCSSMALYLATLVIAIWIALYSQTNSKTVDNYTYMQSVANGIMLVSQILMYYVLKPLTVKKTQPRSVA
jgi:hypothetical protein